MSDLLNLFLLIILFGVGLGLVNAFVPMPSIIRSLLNLVVLVILILYVLQYLHYNPLGISLPTLKVFR